MGLCKYKPDWPDTMLWACRLTTKGWYLRWTKYSRVTGGTLSRQPVYCTDVNDAWLMTYSDWMDVLPIQNSTNKIPTGQQPVQLLNNYELVPVHRKTVVIEECPFTVAVLN